MVAASRQQGGQCCARCPLSIHSAASSRPAEAQSPYPCAADRALLSAHWHRQWHTGAHSHWHWHTATAAAAAAAAAGASLELLEAAAASSGKAAATKAVPRSDSVLLVKNLPYSASEAELEALFGAVGGSWGPFWWLAATLGFLGILGLGCHPSLCMALRLELWAIGSSAVCDGAV